jgi:hypothetical protein
VPGDAYGMTCCRFGDTRDRRLSLLSSRAHRASARSCHILAVLGLRRAGFSEIPLAALRGLSFGLSVIGFALALVTG